MPLFSGERREARRIDRLLELLRGAGEVPGLESALSLQARLQRGIDAIRLDRRRWSQGSPTRTGARRARGKREERRGEDSRRGHLRSAATSLTGLAGALAG